MIKQAVLVILIISLHVFAEDVNFEKQIWPILKDKCIKCHGPDQIDKGKLKHAKAGLRLDSAESIKTGSEDGPVIQPGNSKKSSFYKLISLDPEDEDIMPPKGKPLSKKQQLMIKSWIDQGAKFGDWQEHSVKLNSDVIKLLDELVKAGATAMQNAKQHLLYWPNRRRNGDRSEGV